MDAPSDEIYCSLIAGQSDTRSSSLAGMIMSARMQSSHGSPLATFPSVNSPADAPLHMTYDAAIFYNAVYVRQGDAI